MLMNYSLKNIKKLVEFPNKLETMEGFDLAKAIKPIVEDEFETKKSKIYLQEGVMISSEDLAYKYSKKLALTGNAEGQYLYGYIFHFFEEGPEVGYELSKLWFEKAAQQGHEKAAFYLKRIAEIESGVENEDLIENIEEH